MSGREAYEAFFREADADNSGALTEDELVQLLRRKGYRGSESELKAIFRAVDTSGDGKVSLEEFLVAMGLQPPRTHGLAAMRRVFLDLDKDGNGLIDRAELTTLFRGEVGSYFSQDDLVRMMRVVDDDRSGSIDYREFLRNVFGVEI